MALAVQSRSAKVKVRAFWSHRARGSAGADSRSSEEERAMQEQPLKDKEPNPPVADDFEELARHLREAEHLEPEAREKAADLLGAMAEALEEPEPSAHTERLAESTAELVRAVKDRREPSLIEKARERLLDAVARADAKAPLATELALQLIDVLAGIGI
jgi:hypothetical protein